MPLILPGNVGSATAATGFNVANSCRFDGSSSYMQKTLGTPTSAKKATFSLWFKTSDTKASNGGRCLMSWGNDYGAIYVNETNDGQWEINLDNSDTVYKGTAGGQLSRDPTAWSHLCLIIDTTNSTANDRFQFFLNNVRVVFSANNNNNPDENYDVPGLADGQVIAVGRRHRTTNLYYSGYMAQVCFIDGNNLAATQFGEVDEDSGIFKPIDVSGLTFGNNGFYLDFEASGNLGNDANGGTDLTESGLAAVDQSTDTCTNNFCTWNPLDTFYNTMTFQEGNTQGTKPNSTVESYGTSTFGMTSGKWYAEFKVISFSGSNSTIGFGIIDRVAVQNDKEIGKHTYGISYKSNGDVFSADGNLLTNQGTLAANDIIGLYIDIDNLKFYFAKNGTIANSGTGLAIPALTSTLNGVYFFGFDNFQAGGSVHQANWGNPAYTGTDKADANGFGSFEYDPSSGTFDSASKDFLALCTKNLAESG